jgi:hypothetical protein
VLGSGILIWIWMLMLMWTCCMWLLQISVLTYVYAC